MVTKGITMAFFISVARWFLRRDTPTSYVQKPTWIKNIMTTVTQ
jgi:hypothetical protein